MTRLDNFFSDEPEKPKQPDSRLDDDITSGRTMHINAPQYVTDTDNWIECTHGWDKGDYLWHIAPRRKKKQWKYDMTGVLTMFIGILSQYIPPSVEVKIWLPFRDWEIKEITFRAMDLKSCWNFDEKTLKEIVARILKDGNRLV